MWFLEKERQNRSESRVGEIIITAFSVPGFVINNICTKALLWGLEQSDDFGSSQVYLSRI